MQRIPFTKAQGAGNDFLIVETSPEVPDLALECRRRICDRRYGVGADGILLVTVPGASKGIDADLRIFNSDGGEVEISGNGTRCAAAYLVATKHLGPEMAVQTGAGPRKLRLVERHENRFVFDMEMDAPVLAPKDIPFRPSASVADAGPVVAFSLPLTSGVRKVTVTSMGNPHCSIEVENFDWDWKAVGGEIENHPFFPNRTNVEFYRVVSPHEIEVRYWERGVGFTLSSGTGSCGATVAAILNGLVQSPVTVHTLAGDLRVAWQQGQSVVLGGPAEIICRGEFLYTE